MNSRIKEDVQKIFEFWCEVAKTENRYKNTDTGIIIESFPESYHDEQIITKIPDFAYPCEFEHDSVQSYSFVLTSDDSKWRFGFCRHDPKTQTAMIIITYLPWHDTFLRLLSILGELRRNKNGEFESFLAEAYSKGVPELGANLKLFYNSGQNHFIFQRPSQFQLPSIPENHNLNLYYNFVDPKNMISVFAAMLAERRIIFTSRRFDKLSSCIQAANAFLYPMVWQHIFIPVLPMKMKDILSAPMPYLIGVPEAVLQTMTPEELGDVVILNCDNGKFQNPFDDVKSMPPEIVSQIKKQLSNSHDHIGDKVSKIFLGVLVQLIGGYRDAVQFTQGQKITWDRDTFIESRPSHLRPFLTKMMELQIFQQFIEERLEMLNTGLGFSDEFELETLRYSEKIGRRGKHYKEFLKNVKEKTNPAVKSAVKSVKEGSRGVKTAYKDLKSKLRDITPPKSQFHSYVPQQTSKHEAIEQQNSHGNEHHHTHHQHNYRSVPNSPVFSKRSTNLDMLNVPTNKKAGSSLQTSNSQILNGFNSYTNNNTSTNLSVSNNNSNHLSKSPTISPSSSLCSSDMNISQELQNHPLFKLPAVDRSLKPSSSLEYSGMKGAKHGPSIITLNENKSILSPKIDVPIENVCINDDDDNGQKINSSAIYTTDSLFDSPPNMPSPPIPPKRTNSNKNLDKKKILPAAGSLTFETNFIDDVSDDVKQQKQQHQKQMMDSTTLTSTNKQSIKGCVVPIPTLRHKTKELPKAQPDTIKDLISLDDSNNISFELEDFDPLNQNAKPFPPLSAIPNQNIKQMISPVEAGETLAAPASLSATVKTFLPNNLNLPSISSSSSVSTSSSVHNPLYPYFSPQHRHTTPKQDNLKLKDDDFELLRKYGLDQFSLTNGNSDSRKALNKSNWMVFD